MKKLLLFIGFLLCILVNNSIFALAETNNDENIIETNEIGNWPTGPELNAESAFLYEANTGVILYAKNIHRHLYPASTTKMMTALLTAENCKMDEIVNFSHDAVFSLESGSSNIGIDPGQALSVEECLYGLMVGSANEVANALAEHIGGSMDGFAELMNKRAEELGLKDTHYTNANGLNDPSHYTSAHDLAMVANEFFKNEYLSKIGNTPTYHFEPTATQPDDFYLRNKHKLINGDIQYVGIKGGKTGYTSEAGETLVTCAEQNGMKLICVIMNEVSPEQFNDTVKLFDYGFSNFAVTNVSENEKKYTVESTNFFPTTVDILGNSEQFLELNKDNYIIMPKNITFQDLDTTLSYETKEASEVAYIEYSYHGAYLGYGCIDLIKDKKVTSAFDSTLSEELLKETQTREKPVFINILNIFERVIIIALGLIILNLIISVFINYNILDNFKSGKKYKKRKNRKDKGGLKF